MSDDPPALPNRAKLPTARKRPPGMPQKRKLARKPNWIYLVGCLCLMGCFFMPWFSTPLGSVLGFEISYYVPRFLYAFRAPPLIVLASNSLWALAFIGVFAFFGLGMELASLQKAKNQWWLRMLTAFSPWIAFGIIFISFAFASTDELVALGGALEAKGVEGEEVATGLLGILWNLLLFSSWGLWIMLLGAVLCVVSIWKHPGRKKKKPAGVERPRSGAA